MFLPATADELRARGWDACDAILVSGDAYIDSPFSGVALIGRLLEDAGFRVGIIAQPDTASHHDIRRLGEPRLFWGVTAGCVDSMVANYTAAGRPRRSDDFTPGGHNNRRPDRATIAYANLIRAAFKNTVPIVLGGIEASLRRVPHYDYWSNKIRRSILFDAKADILCHGMADRTILQLAAALRDHTDWRAFPGLCYSAPQPPPNAVELPPFSSIISHSSSFLDFFKLFTAHQDPLTAATLAQQNDTRWLIHTPPPPPLTTAELDHLHALPFQRDAHPLDAARGKIPALDTIRFAITTHRGCYGACHFCAIALHQGRAITSRSPASILNEARAFLNHPKFTGTISDLGGPTANMYAIDCPQKSTTGACPDRHCLTPAPCPRLKPDHAPQISLLHQLRQIPGIRHIFIASGIRPDLLLADEQHAQTYIDLLASHHTSGQLKLAPEHADPNVLRHMNKPPVDATLRFKTLFDTASRAANKKQFLTYYLIAAHPGCTLDHMRGLRHFCLNQLRHLPEQIQLFTPTPSTWSTTMYHTRLTPDGETLFVETNPAGRDKQKAMMKYE